MVFNPTYDYYVKLLDQIKKTGKLMDYTDAKNSSQFIVLRHDIEFSVEHAMEMAIIENQKEVASSYFVQIRSNAYNALSLKNVSLLQKIYEYGHHIGLHYHVGESHDPRIVAEEIEEQCDLLQRFLQIPINRYSVHRPKKETKYYCTNIPGLINVYGPEFFTFVETIEENPVLKVKYISDAKHQWNYGTPDNNTIQNEPKIQLLIHPDYWSTHSAQMGDNFAELILEHAMVFTETIDCECHHFSEFRDHFERMARYQYTESLC